MTNKKHDHRHLVLRVNEIFHDLEGEEYEHIHPEIFEQERDRWNRMLDRHLPQGQPLTVLDLGTGTGFVGEHLLARMSTDSRLICADISAVMLDVSRKRLQSLFPHHTIDILKMQDERIPAPDASMDVVTMNSVLHHIPDSDAFLSEVMRVLKPGGLLCIGHEPNIRFFQSSFLVNQYRLFHQLAPRRIAASLLKMTGLYSPIVKQKNDAFMNELSKRLMDEGLIDRLYTRAEISPLLDIHSPTAGGIRKEEGFDPITMFKGSALQTLDIETYNHLSKLSGKHWWTTPYEWALARLRPKDGSIFFLVAQKSR